MGHAKAARHLAAAVTAVSLLALPGTSMAWDPFGDGRSNGYNVSHDGIYLVQRIGQCLNHTGPCYYGGQCPGGEYTTNAYANGRVYCQSFWPSHPYPPSVFEHLLGVR